MNENGAVMVVLYPPLSDDNMLAWEGKEMALWNFMGCMGLPT